MRSNLHRAFSIGIRGFDMATERGRAIQNLQRARHNAERISERIAYLAADYSDYEEWSKSVKLACGVAESLVDFIQNLLNAVP